MIDVEVASISFWIIGIRDINGDNLEIDRDAYLIDNRRPIV